jgi:hypothetical protein
VTQPEAVETSPFAPNASGTASEPGASGRSTLYPQAYLWYLFLSSLDVIFTWLILQAGGYEVNVLAQWVLSRHGVRGMILLKFVLLTFVILVCEMVGRRKYATGQKLARWAVVITAFPVAVGACYLLDIALTPVE